MSNIIKFFPGFFKVHFFPGREKCIYALFETRTGILLYGIGLAVLNRIPTKTLSLEITRAL